MEEDAGSARRDDGARVGEGVRARDGESEEVVDYRSRYSLVRTRFGPRTVTEYSGRRRSFVPGQPSPPSEQEKVNQTLTTGTGAIKEGARVRAKGKPSDSQGKAK